MIKIPHEKMLNANYLHWFHTDTSVKNKLHFAIDKKIDKGHTKEKVTELLSLC